MNIKKNIQQLQLYPVYNEVLMLYNKKINAMNSKSKMYLLFEYKDSLYYKTPALSEEIENVINILKSPLIIYFS